MDSYLLASLQLHANVRCTRTPAVFIGVPGLLRFSTETRELTRTLQQTYNLPSSALCTPGSLTSPAVLPYYMRICDCRVHFKTALVDALMRSHLVLFFQEAEASVSRIPFSISLPMVSPATPATPAIPASSVCSEAWLSGPAGHRFYTRTYAADKVKAVVLFVHGFADHISRYEDAHTQFAQRGIAVFAYDLRGFGRTALDIENRSPDESYGKTSRQLEINDLQFWINYVAGKFPTKPIFLLGYSAGGGLALAFPTRRDAPPSTDTVAKLAGVMRPALVVANGISKVAPWLPFPAPMPEEYFSRDPAVVIAIKKDPLRMARGTIRGLLDMLGQGEELLEESWRYWPKDLPLLMLWGTADESACPRAGSAFFKKLDINDKKLVEYENVFHDLLHEADNIPEKVMEEYCSWIESHLEGR
ncbi:hypothetical protein NUW54_g178 [Trametes sanguinea]|uniref:Uncharacterized protein n=1 Tax=Trametes sanguinea TaxID=158606 RepID=A0ACC1Q9X3_9APHY|nr:hypothetical protein NUW54_g178 [Trametes sanguinea]